MKEPPSYTAALDHSSYIAAEIRNILTRFNTENPEDAVDLSEREVYTSYNCVYLHCSLPNGSKSYLSSLIVLAG